MTEFSEVEVRLMRQALVAYASQTPFGPARAIAEQCLNKLTAHLGETRPARHLSLVEEAR